MVDPGSTIEQVPFFAPNGLKKLNGGTKCTSAEAQLRARLGQCNSGDIFLENAHRFLDHYLRAANITDAEIDSCIRGMFTDKHTSFISKNKAGTEYELKSPFIDDTLDSIIEQIMSHNPRAATDPLHFKLFPSGVADNVDGFTLDLDAGLTEVDQDDPIPASGILVPMVVVRTRHTKLRLAIRQTILQACRCILNEDPRRMWIFALMFEGDMVSIWYFSRSHSVKTFAANWTVNPRLLVRIILSFVNAGKEALGIDPMIHIAPPSDDGKTISYVYEIPKSVASGHSVFYKTGKLRSDGYSSCIAGRGTRVWEVTQVTSADGMVEVDPGKTEILKDVWLAQGQVTETENMDKMFEAVDAFVTAGIDNQVCLELEKNLGASRESINSNSETMERLLAQLVDSDELFEHFVDADKDRLKHHLTNKNYRSMFLTKVHAWQGVVSERLIETAKRSATCLFELDPSYKNVKKIPVTTAKKSADQAEGRKKSAKTSSKESHLPVQQFRVVYDEVCHSLYEIDTLGEVADILRQALDALHMFYIAGWVHRDLSPGNILAVRAGPQNAWIAKLSDFEYARKMVDPDRKVESDNRIGTPPFMPIEIIRRRYFCADHWAPEWKGTSRYAAIIERHGLKRETLAERFQLAETHPAYSTFSNMLVCHSGRSYIDYFATPPTDADYTKVPARSAIVNHNFQHDLESIWWILLWFVTMNVKHEPSYNWAHKYFYYDMDEKSGYNPRLYLFDQQLDAGRDPISEYMREDLDTFIELLEALMGDMCHAGIHRQLYGQIDLHKSYSTIEGYFSDCFRALCEHPDDAWRNVELGTHWEP